MKDIKHEISKQECEHKQYISGLKHRLNQEVHGVISEAEAERCRFEFELRSLEDELATRNRIYRGEEERLHVRKGLYQSELDSLHLNLDKCIGLIGIARDQMNREIEGRKIEGAKMYADCKKSHEEKVRNIRDEYERSKQIQKDNIRDVEGDLENIHRQ